MSEPGFPRVLGHHQARRRDGDRAEPRDLHQRAGADARARRPGRGDGADAGEDAHPDGRRRAQGAPQHRQRLVQARQRQADAGAGRRAGQAVRRPDGELGGRCDFVNDVALHFPLQVILSILGLPEDDYPKMLKLTQELFGAEDPDIGRMGEDQSMLEVLLDFVNYFTALANDRRARIRPRTSRR